MPKSMTSWKPGQSGNPLGRPKNSAKDELDRSIRRVQDKKNKKLLDHFVERAYEDNTVLIAVIKKLVPDIKFIESEHKTDNTIRVIVKEMDMDKFNNSKVNFDKAGKLT